MPQNIDLLIIKPGSPKIMYGDLSKSLSAIEPPYLAVLLAAFIREKGYSVKIIDTEIEELGIWNPVLVNIIVAGQTPSASSTPLMVVSGEIIKKLKAKTPETKTILTGIHPSALPGRTLREEKTDFIGRGESFYTILELLKTLKLGKKTENYNIQGLWYLKDNKVVSNGWGRLVQDLDEFPIPAWELLQMDKYRAHNWHCFGHINERTPYAAIYTSFGCPYNCTYCNIRALYDNKPGIRFRNAEKIVEEIDLLVNKYKVKNIKFCDELFAIDSDRVNQLCDLLAQRDYNLNIWAYARINTIDERILRKMKRAGINWLGYGIESGSQKIRTGVSKAQFKQDEIKKIVTMTKDAGIYVGGNYIFGLPDDNLETMQETLDLAKELNCEMANFYTAMAYPGSQLYEEALKKGVKLPKSWLGYAQLNEETLPLPTKYLSSSEILCFRDKAFQEYYANPKYLKMIKEKFGQEAVSHINEMLKYKVKRKFTS
jgi:radical SAM superfamily enzyme YgiQ (UPF0313 family)